MPTTTGAAPSPRSRIQALLERTAVTPDDVAAGMLLPEGVTLERVLDGSYEPSLSELLGAADVLDVPVGVLTGDIPADGHLGVSLRLGAVEGAEDLADALGHANRLLDRAALLDSWLGAAPAPARDVLDRVMLSQHRLGKRAGAVTAERVRAALGLSDEEPVADMVGLIEDLGIPVVFLQLTDNVHGLNVRDVRSGGLRRLVLVSSADVWTKQRYTLAHEMCHALYDDADQVIVDRADEPDAIPEWRAEAFARHLLLPARAVQSAVDGRGYQTWEAVAAQLMVRFGVSRDVVVIALRETGHVPEERLGSLSAAYVEDLMRAADLAEAWRAFSQSQHADSASPTLVARAAQAYSNGWIRSDIVAELMDQNVSRTEQELASAGWLPPVPT